MDPNLLRHIEYFLEPNSQTQVRTPDTSMVGRETTERAMPGRRPGPAANTSQSGDLESQQRRFNASSSTSSAQNFWDMPVLNDDSALGSPSSGPPSLSFETFGQSAAPAPTKPQQPRPQQFTQGSRVILPPRPPKVKAGHERKRTKLSTESTPFDNVDYWIQFDNEEAAGGDTSPTDLSHQKTKDAHQSSQQQQHQARR